MGFKEFVCSSRTMRSPSIRSTCLYSIETKLNLYNTNKATEMWNNQLTLLSPWHPVWLGKMKIMYCLFVCQIGSIIKLHLWNPVRIFIFWSAENHILEYFLTISMVFFIWLMLSLVSSFIYKYLKMIPLCGYWYLA